MKKYNLFNPSVFIDESLENLRDLFCTGYLAEGDAVREFESEFSSVFDYEFCLSVNSGTSALELAYDLIGIKEGDEVISTVLTAAPTTVPLHRRGATVRFCDIMENLIISPESLKQKINNQTKAVVAVTLGGLPIPYEISSICLDAGVPLVIDAAQSTGVSEMYGDYVCHSFQAVKHFTCGDGGMLVLRSEEEYEKAKKLRWYGVDRSLKSQFKWDSLDNLAKSIDIKESGYKYHMNNISAVLGLVGLKHSFDMLEKRKRISSWYEKYINRFDLINGGSHWLQGVIVDNSFDFIKSMKSKGVGSDMCHIRNDLFSIFGSQRQCLPVMNDYESKYSYVPMYIDLTELDVKDISNRINLHGI
tara:strand:+ start:8671 stop:9750 length:1080 start_codon:yes stop_codon:yes gene_type:complete